MSFTVGGSTPQLTFADATVQNTAFTGLNQSATPFATSLGYQALNSNTGANNTAVGYQALYSNTTATNNTAYGYQAGYSAVTGATNNTFIGYQAGYSTITSGSNQFFGYLAGYNVTTGYYNTILGSYNGNQGGLDIRTASNYIVLSDGAGNPRAYWDNNGEQIFPSNSFAATSYNSSAGSSYTVTLPTGYGAFELSISAYSYNAGVYGVRATVFHCFGYDGYPRTVYAPNVNTIDTMVTNMSGTAPTISISTGVNGALNVTIAGAGTLGSGYTLRRLNLSPSF